MCVVGLARLFRCVQVWVDISVCGIGIAGGKGRVGSGIGWWWWVVVLVLVVVLVSAVGCVLGDGW